MGMDVIGLRPKNEAGKYFYSTIVRWVPLWDYLAEVCSDILTAADIEAGYGNDHHVIRAKNATAIGKRLMEELAARRAEKRLQRKRRPKNASVFGANALDAVRQVARATGGQVSSDKAWNASDIQEFAAFCVASGGFRID